VSKVLGFNSHDEIPNLMIEIVNSDEFLSAAKELSEFVLSLSLSHADNDKLIKLMVKQVRVAERSAFDQGAQWGALLKEIDEGYSE